jgi:hypothetical protein
MFSQLGQSPVFSFSVFKPLHLALYVILSLFFVSFSTAPSMEIVICLSKDKDKQYLAKSTFQFYLPHYQNRCIFTVTKAAY